MIQCTVPNFFLFDEIFKIKEVAKKHAFFDVICKNGQNHGF